MTIRRLTWNFLETSTAALIVHVTAQIKPRFYLETTECSFLFLHHIFLGGRVQLKCHETRWRTGRKLKVKLANAVGSQYPSHYLGTRCILHYYRWCAHLGCASSGLNWRLPADLNGLVRLAERRNLVSARVPSHFNWSPTIRRIYFMNLLNVAHIS